MSWSWNETQRGKKSSMSDNIGTILSSVLVTFPEHLLGPSIVYMNRTIGNKRQTVTGGSCKTRGNHLPVLRRNQWLLFAYIPHIVRTYDSRQICLWSTERGEMSACILQTRLKKMPYKLAFSFPRSSLHPFNRLKLSV